MSNDDTETKAIELCVAYEQERLGHKDASEIIRMQKGSGYDLQSPDRNIEVKGSRGKDINKGLVLNSKLEVNSLENGGYLYRVLDVFGSPELYVFTIENLNITERYRADVRIPKEINSQAEETNAF